MDNKPKSIRVSDIYLNNDKPDFWIDPDSSVVFEVKVANLSLSLVHTGGKGTVDEERGVAARLPRLVRMRDDKNPSQCSSMQFVVERYKDQPDRDNDDGENAGDCGDDLSEE